jgi:hypothetical protein
VTATERRRQAAETRAFDEIDFADFAGEPAPTNGDDVLEYLGDLGDDDLDGPVPYDPIAEAVRLARYGMAVSPWVLTGRDKNPALPGSWLQNATCKINEVVEDFEHAVSKYGAERVLVGWAIGRDGFCAMDNDHGLHESVAVILDHPHGINQTFRGEHIIFRNPMDLYRAIRRIGSLIGVSANSAAAAAASSSAVLTAPDSIRPSSSAPGRSRSRTG